MMTFAMICNYMMATIPSFDLGPPPSPPSTTTPIPHKTSRRLPADDTLSCLSPSSPQHPNIPSPASSTSPVTPPGYEGDGAKTVSSCGPNNMRYRAATSHHHTTTSTCASLPRKHESPSTQPLLTTPPHLGTNDYGSSHRTIHSLTLVHAVPTAIYSLTLVCAIPTLPILDFPAVHCTQFGSHFFPICRRLFPVTTIHLGCLFHVSLLRTMVS